MGDDIFKKTRIRKVKIEGLYLHMDAHSRADLEVKRKKKIVAL